MKKFFWSSSSYVPPPSQTEKEKFVKQIADAMEKESFVSGIGLADKLAIYPGASSLANGIVQLRRQLKAGKISQDDYNQQVKELMED